MGRMDNTIVVFTTDLEPAVSAGTRSMTSANALAVPSPTRILRRLTAALAVLALSTMAGAQGIYAGDPGKETYKLPGDFEPVMQLRTYYFEQENTSGTKSAAFPCPAPLGRSVARNNIRSTQ